MKNIKLNAANIISIRKNLDNTIIKYWKIIRSENVISKKAESKGLYSGYNLKALYNEITQMSEKRILIKGILQCLNNGITTFDFNSFKKTNNYSIFAASEAKEIIAQLKMIKTLDPSTKAKKGLKVLPKKETFSSAKIASLIAEQQRLVNKYDANLTKFNDNTSIELSADISDKFTKDIAA